MQAVLIAGKQRIGGLFSMKKKLSEDNEAHFNIDTIFAMIYIIATSARRRFKAL